MAKSYIQGKYRPINIKKYAGDPTNIVYRSSWELKLMLWLDRDPSVLKWNSEETIIPYRCKTDNRMHRYFVDFKATMRDGTVYIIEVKPHIQTLPPVQKSRITKSYHDSVMTYAKNTSKWEAAKIFCEDRGYEFMIVNEYDLGIKKRPK